MSTIKTIRAISKSTDPLVASRELFEQLNHPDIGFVLFYCSVVYALDDLAETMQNTFANIEVAGCTTAGEITPEGFEQHSIVAIGFSRHYFAISATVIESMASFDLVSAQSTVNQLTESCRAQNLTPIKNNTFLLTLIDGLSTQEEQFLSTLNSAASGIPHFGGSAGDDIHLARTHVFHQGKFYQQAAIVIMVNTRCPFEVFRCNHIKLPTEKLVVTEADAEARIVYELNAEPAAIEYARLLNIAVKDLNPDVFSLHPLAVKVGGQYFIRAIQKVNKEDLSLTFYCAIDNGIVLTAVEMGSIVDSLSQKLANIAQHHDKPELVLACDCILRRLEIEQKGVTKQIQQLQSDYNITGFNTYGEHINGIHLNQTFTGVYLAGDVDE